MPARAGTARVRYADGAPSLEALINGYPQDIGTNAYLQANSQTAVSPFVYGTFSSFTNVTAGALSLTARNPLGYSVGPLKTAALSAGKRYTLIVVGSYPHYKVLAFEEPASTGSAQLSLYAAAPSMRQASFGSFQVSTDSNFKQLGSAKFGNLATVTVGKSVSDFGGYVGTPRPIGTAVPAQINSFDSQNALPFHNASRLSLFLFDPKSGTSIGPVFGSLDE